MLASLPFHLSAAPLDRELLGNLAEQSGIAAIQSCPTTPDDKPDPDDPGFPPEPFDRRPAVPRAKLRFTPKALSALRDYLGSHAPEKACILMGPKGSDLVSGILPDETGQSTPVSFTLDAPTLNANMKPLLAAGLDAKGLAHSHPFGIEHPSGGDYAYVADVFAKHPHCLEYAFPIVIGRDVFGFMARRRTSEEAFQFEQADLEVVEPPMESESKPAAKPRRGKRNDYSRIEPLMNIEHLERSVVTIVGCGGGANLARNLARCGVGRINLVDFDIVERVNICRQEYGLHQIKMRKVDALAEDLKKIRGDVRIRRHRRNLLDLSDRYVDREFGDSNLFILAVDNLGANARGNEIALRLGKKALYSGLYAGGRAAELVWWKPSLPCYRCLCSARYRAKERGEDTTQPNESADILSVQILDGIAGKFAIGLLTEGSDDVHGRLIAQHGRRNFLQMKFDPAWTWNGRDLFREQLRIPDDTPAYCSFVSIAREDPTNGLPACPDCLRFGHVVVQENHHD